MRKHEAAHVLLSGSTQDHEDGAVRVAVRWDRDPAAAAFRVSEHPCFSEQAARRYGRIHLAVAPACNVQCNYCNRSFDCANESRPGSSSEQLTPAQAAAKARQVLAARPEIRVVGIAGPGDPLASGSRTFETIAFLRRDLPDVRICLATNGLLLPEHVQLIRRYRIDYVTITINALRPEVGAAIYAWIYHCGRRYRGPEGARLLASRQLRGLEMLADSGVLCKVNSVVIPGVNDDEIVAVHRAIRERGAFAHNVTPLISRRGDGTAFGLSGQRPPTRAEVEAVRARCDGGVHLMRHCQQCRADAVGMLAGDCGAGLRADAASLHSLGAAISYRRIA
jgi:nitrogen fixation protein NifB